MLCTVYNIVHTASVARHIYLRPGAGVGAMQKIYGGELRIDVYCSVVIDYLIANVLIQLV